MHFGILLKKKREATIKVFWVEKERDADIKVFKVDKDRNAKWNKSNSWTARLG